MAKKDNPIEQRVQEMAEWSAKFEKWSEGVNEQLADLTAAMVVSTEEHADSIALQLADLRSKQGDSSTQYKKALEDKLQLGVEISKIKERMQEIEDPVLLDIAFDMDEKGKPRFSNDTLRSAQMRRVLADNDIYSKLKEELHNREMDVARARAIIESIDRDDKDYGRAVDNLTSRLDNLTARFARRKEN